MIKRATYFLILLHFLRMLIRRAVSVPLADHQGSDGFPGEFTCKLAFFYRMKSNKSKESYILFATVFSLNSFAIRSRFLKFLLEHQVSTDSLAFLDINDDPNTFLKNRSVCKQIQMNHGTILTYIEWADIMHCIINIFFHGSLNGTYNWDNIEIDKDN